MGGGVLLRPGVHQEVVSALGADDEPLLAVENPGVSIAARNGSCPKEVGAAAGFSQGLGDGELPLQGRSQPALLLLRRTEDAEPLANDAHQAVQAGKAGAQDADLLQSHDLFSPAESSPAVLLIEAQPQKPAAGGGLKELSRVGYLPRVHVQDELAGHLVADEGPHLVPEAPTNVCE